MKRKGTSFSNLSDEELVYKYKKSSLPKGRWQISEELFERYEGLIKQKLRNKFTSISQSTFEDLIHDIKRLVIEKGIIEGWDPEKGKNVKNYLIDYYNDYLPSKTITYKTEIKKPKTVDSPRPEDIQDNDIDIETKIQLSEFERMGEEFIKKALNGSDSLFSKPRKKGRKKVLEALWENYRGGNYYTDPEKAKEVSMTPSSFKSRKQRALDNLVEELDRQGKRVDFLWYVEFRFNYRSDAISARIEEKVEDSKD